MNGRARWFLVVGSLVLVACSSDDPAGVAGTTSDGGSTAEASVGTPSTPGDAGDAGAAETGSTDPEAPASCLPLLQPRAGVYPVTGTAVEPAGRGASTATHKRGTVTVGADGAIDFDTGLAQPAKAIVECYDRTAQSFDRRVQVSYGADDNALVVNLYLSGAGAVEEIQYRVRTDNVNVRVLVGAPAK